MALYFRVRDHREVSAAEALDSRGVLKSGYGQRVPAQLRDARQLWDSGGLVVTDADLTGGSGNRPGWRVADSPLNKGAIADAHIAYVNDLENAWRNPLRLGDAAPPRDPDEDEDDEDDDDLPQGELEQLTTATDGRMVDVAAVSSAHQVAMSEIYRQIADSLSQQYRKG